MEGSSSKGKQKAAELSSTTTKKSGRKLNQDMIDQMGSPGARSHRAKTNLPIREQLEDIYKGIGDIFTILRGHELFLFHYFRRDEPMPISNPWKTGLGKLVVPNVFVNIDLLKLLVRNYNANK